MEDRYLECFVRVCEERNLTRAANKMNITQQALSKTMIKMEEELGVPLFIRHNSGLEITEYGEVVLEYACRRLQEAGQMKKALITMKLQEHTPLSLAYGVGMLIKFPSDYIGQFMLSHPDDTFSIYSYIDTETGRLKNKFSCHMLLASTIPSGDQFRMIAHIKNKTSVILSKEHPLMKKDTLCLSDLSDYPLMFCNIENDYFGHIYDKITEKGLSATIVTNPSELPEYFGILAKSNMVSLYGGCEKNLPETLILRELQDLDVWSNSYIFVRRDYKLTPLEEEFATYLIKGLMGLPKAYPVEQ